MEIILEEMKKLLPSKLYEAANFIRQHKVRSESERRQALDRAYGCLSEEEAQAMEAVIQASCERINACQW